MRAYKCDRSYTHDQYTMLIAELKEDQKGGGAMNDCVFFEACPEDCKCAECKDYISMNCELGEEIMRTYVLKIDEACKPVKEWLRGVRDGNN